MRTAFLLCLAAAPWLPAVAADAAQPSEFRSVCQIAGKLLPGCLALRATGTRGEVSLDFAVEGDGQQRTVVAGIGETTAKTSVFVRGSQGVPKRLRPVEEQSEWCNPKKD